MKDPTRVPHEPTYERKLERAWGQPLPGLGVAHPESFPVKCPVQEHVSQLLRCLYELPLLKGPSGKSQYQQEGEGIEGTAWSQSWLIISHHSFLNKQPNFIKLEKYQKGLNLGYMAHVMFPPCPKSAEKTIFTFGRRFHEPFLILNYIFQGWGDSSWGKSPMPQV